MYVDIQALDSNLIKHRTDSFTSTYSSKDKSRKRSIKTKINDVMKIRDMRDYPHSTVVWDALPQSSSSSRNKTQSRINNISKDKYHSKNTIIHDTSALRLENSQEIKNWFSTLGPGQYHKHLKTDSHKLRADYSSVKHNRGKKDYDRNQEVANVYK